VRASKAMSNATVLIAALVGALVVFNTMLMSVNERTREIGVLLAVGWQRRTLMKLILAESSLISLAGGLIGILLGLGIAAGLGHLDLLRGKIDPLFSPVFMVAALGLALVLGIAGALWPALKAARLRPAHALWHE
jgi:putative ABC transport system permease protein